MTRLDAELVRRGLARSRRRAAELVDAGRVRVDGRPVAKVALAVPPAAELTVDLERDYVSRGGHKLAGALADLADLGTPVPVDGAQCLDAGASTGGFTEVLLEHGARGVDAVDVGHGQIAPQVAADPRVVVREGCNVRFLTAADLTATPQVIVADLSFISLTLVLPALVAVAAEGTHLVVLVKPQFEVGKGRLGADGVVESPELRREAVLAVARAVPEPVEVRAVLPSRLPGPAGNHEYFLHLVHGGNRASDHGAGDLLSDLTGDHTGDLDSAVTAAVHGRPTLVRPPARGIPRRPT